MARFWPFSSIPVLSRASAHSPTPLDISAPSIEESHNPPSTIASSLAVSTPSSSPALSASMLLTSAFASQDDEISKRALGHQLFVEKMKQPLASEFVRALKSLVDKVLSSEQFNGSKPQHVNQLHESINEIFRNICKHSLWAGCGPEELSNVLDSLEKFVMCKLYSRLYGTSAKALEQDEQLRTMLLSLQQFLEPAHLDIPAGYCDPVSLGLAQKELLNMEQFKAPRDKLVCLLNCSKILINTLKKAKDGTKGESGAPCADDFLPLFIYTVVKAAPSHLYLDLEYMSLCRTPSKLLGEPLYFLANLRSAITFVLQLDASRLSIEQNLFNSLMAKARESLDIQDKSTLTTTSTSPAVSEIATTIVATPAEGVTIAESTTTIQAEEIAAMAALPDTVTSALVEAPTSTTETAASATITSQTLTTSATTPAEPFPATVSRDLFAETLTTTSPSDIVESLQPAVVSTAENYLPISPTKINLDPVSATSNNSLHSTDNFDGGSPIPSSDTLLTGLDSVSHTSQWPVSQRSPVSSTTHSAIDFNQETSVSQIFPPDKLISNSLSLLPTSSTLTASHAQHVEVSNSLSEPSVGSISSSFPFPPIPSSSISDASIVAQEELESGANSASSVQSLATPLSSGAYSEQEIFDDSFPASATVHDHFVNERTAAPLNDHINHSNSTKAQLQAASEPGLMPGFADTKTSGFVDLKSSALENFLPDLTPEPVTFHAPLHIAATTFGMENSSETLNDVIDSRSTTSNSVLAPVSKTSATIHSLRNSSSSNFSSATSPPIDVSNLEFILKVAAKERETDVPVNASVPSNQSLHSCVIPALSQVDSVPPTGHHESDQENISTSSSLALLSSGLSCLPDTTLSSKLDHSISSSSSGLVNFSPTPLSSMLSSNSEGDRRFSRDFDADFRSVPDGLGGIQPTPPESLQSVGESLPKVHSSIALVPEKAVAQNVSVVADCSKASLDERLMSKENAKSASFGSFVASSEVHDDNVASAFDINTSPRTSELISSAVFDLMDPLSSASSFSLPVSPTLAGSGSHSLSASFSLSEPLAESHTSVIDERKDSAVLLRINVLNQLAKVPCTFAHVDVAALKLGDVPMLLKEYNTMCDLIRQIQH